MLTTIKLIPMFYVSKLLLSSEILSSSKESQQKVGVGILTISGEQNEVFWDRRNVRIIQINKNATCLHVSTPSDSFSVQK